jgi:hypothetical protein
MSDVVVRASGCPVLSQLIWSRSPVLNRVPLLLSERRTTMKSPVEQRKDDIKGGEMMTL